MNKTSQLRRLLEDSLQDINEIYQEVWMMKQELEALKQQISIPLQRIEAINRDFPIVPGESKFGESSDCD